MKFAIAFAALLALAVAMPQKPEDVQILKYENDNIGVEGYRFAVETSDGSSRQEQAELRNAGSENEHLAVSGSFQYVGDDGVTYKVTYVADENGFQPQGDHLPKVEA